MEFCIRIANRTVKIHSIYPRIRRMCQDYLYEFQEKSPDGSRERISENSTQEKPDLEITITRREIEQERARSAEGTSYSDAYLETLAVYRKIAEGMLSYQTYLMHGAVLAYETEAGPQGVLFTAPSGTGKTTHIRLWLEQFPDTYVVNGDKPLLIVEENQVIACGTPWSGKEQMNRNCQVPLKSICILERAAENWVKQTSLEETIETLLRQTYRPEDPMLMLATMQLVGQMGEQVKIYRIGCNMEPEAAQVVRSEIVVG